MTGNHLASDPFLDRAATLATGSDLSRDEAEGPLSHDDDNAAVDSDGFTAGPSSAPARTRILDDVFRDPTLSRLVLAVLRARGIPEEDREELRLDVLTSLYVWCRRDLTHETGAEARRIARELTRTCARIYRRRVAPPQVDSAVDAIEVKTIVAEIGDLLETGNLSEKAAATLVALTEDATYAVRAEETEPSVAEARTIETREVARVWGRGLRGAGLPLVLFLVGLAIAAAMVIRGYFGGPL